MQYALNRAVRACAAPLGKGGVGECWLAGLPARYEDADVWLAFSSGDSAVWGQAACKCGGAGQMLGYTGTRSAENRNKALP